MTDKGDISHQTWLEADENQQITGGDWSEQAIFDMGFDAAWAYWNTRAKLAPADGAAVERVRDSMVSTLILAGKGLTMDEVDDLARAALSAMGEGQ